MPLNRRHFLAAGVSSVAALSLGQQRSAIAAAPSGPVPVRAITKGPKHHWFAYYDKLQFDPTNRYALSNQVDFEHRTPKPSDVIQVGMIDLKDNDRWIELGQSNAWGWQQGCMLQWRPGSASEVLWNDREGDRYVSRLLDVRTKQMRTIPSPLYSVAPNGQFGITADFARIQSMRPGYGYVGLPDEFADERAPKDSGIFHVDLETGERKLILSLAEVAKIPVDGERVDEHSHWFNHLLVSPDSKRFTALNRWRVRDPQTGELNPRWSTRMVTANIDGSDLYILNLSPMISHFVWRDPDHLCMWTKPHDQPPGFYLVQDKTSRIEPVGQGVMLKDGHNTYVHQHPDWILCDAYPDAKRNQIPYLYHVPTNRRFDLGAFHSPEQYKGEWRCDTHPRSSNDGRMVTIDSPHGGNGRQVYLLDVSAILKS